jgi:hypothetical protein
VGQLRPACGLGFGVAGDRLLGVPWTAPGREDGVVPRGTGAPRFGGSWPGLGPSCIGPVWPSAPPRQQPPRGSAFHVKHPVGFLARVQRGYWGPPGWGSLPAGFRVNLSDKQTGLGRPGRTHRPIPFTGSRVATRGAPGRVGRPPRVPRGTGPGRCPCRTWAAPGDDVRVPRGTSLPGGAARTRPVSLHVSRGTAVPFGFGAGARVSRGTRSGARPGIGGATFCNRSHASLACRPSVFHVERGTVLPLTRSPESGPPMPARVVHRTHAHLCLRPSRVKSFLSRDEYVGVRSLCGHGPISIPFRAAVAPPKGGP